MGGFIVGVAIVIFVVGCIFIVKKLTSKKKEEKDEEKEVK